MTRITRIRKIFLINKYQKNSRISYDHTTITKHHTRHLHNEDMNTEYA